MKLIISKEILNKFPKLNIGIITAKGTDNKKAVKEISHLLKEIEDMIKLNFVPSKLAKHPLISSWRAAYSEFGAKPHRYHSSVESLMRIILRGEKIKRQNKVVDLSHYLSLKHFIPIGTDDLDKVKGNIVLDFAEGNENFIPIGRKESENPGKEEVVYKDEEKVLCRMWNWLDSEESKVTKESKNIIFYIDGIPPITKKKLKEIVKEIADLVKTFCNGRVNNFILNKKENSAEL